MAIRVTGQVTLYTGRFLQMYMTTILLLLGVHLTNSSAEKILSESEDCSGTFWFISMPSGSVKGDDELN